MSTPTSELVPSVDPRDDSTLGVTDWKRIDALCETFEQAWQATTPIDIKSLVREERDDASSKLLFRELLAIEVEYRTRNDQPIDMQSLLVEFPQYQDIITLVIGETQPLVTAACVQTIVETVPAFLEKHPRYEITNILGSGGMGTVYLARHKVLGRDVAIKVIRSDLLTAPGARDRFLREARTAASLQHPNVVAVYDAEATNDGQFLVMEAVSGADLGRTVRQFGPLPWDAACNAIRQAAKGLEAGWRIGMVHRDLSPRNLMLSDDGTVKLLDFGLASLTSGISVIDPMLARGMLVGSASFISPEQANDPTTSDVRSDLYSLGCVMYFLLTGRPPFLSESLPELLEAHKTQCPPSLGVVSPTVPPEVQAIVARLMFKLPDRRFQTPGELIEALDPWCERESTTTANVSDSTTVTATRKLDRPSRRISAVALAVALCVFVLMFIFREYDRGDPHATTETPEFVQGQSLLAQRQERQVRLAIERFKTLVARQPSNARAFAALAEAYNLCGDYGWDLPDKAFPKAIDAAKQALNIEPDLAEGRLALAFAASVYACDWKEAEGQFRRALEIAPDLPSAHHWFAWLLVQQGRFDEGMAEMEVARRLAPDNLIIINNVGKLLYFTRNYAAAAERHRAALDLDQDFQKGHLDLGYTLIELGQVDEAFSEFDRAMGISTHNWEVKAAQAFALARQGKSDTVPMLLQSLEPVAGQEDLAMEISFIYGALGDLDNSFHWLNDAFQRKSPQRADAAVDPRLDPLRSDPRLKPLLQSIGLGPK